MISICSLRGMLVTSVLGAAAYAQPASPADAGIARGIRLMQARQFAAAKTQMTAALKLDAHSADAYTWRGICENQLREYREAESDFKSALRIDPSAQPAHYNLALSLIRLQQPDAAVRELQTVVAASPDAVQAQYNLALLLEDGNDLAGAQQHLEAAYVVDPSDLGVQQHLLADDLALNKTEQANQILGQMNSAAPEVQAQVGESLVNKGLFAPAASLLEAAHTKLPASADLELALARAYIGINEDYKAIDLLQNSTLPDSSGRRAYVKGLAYLAAGASQDAANSFRAATTADPHNGDAHFQLATLALHSGDASGLAELKEAVRLEPQNAAYSIALGKALLVNDRASEALPYLQQNQAEGKQEAQRNLLLGIAQAATIGVPAARASFERALVLDPSLALAHDLLGFCFFQAGDYDHAVTAYQAAADLDPNTARFAYDTALAFDHLNRSADALTYAQKAAVLNPSSAVNHYMLGKLYTRLDKKPEAIAELETAVRLNPTLDKPYYLLARTYQRMGDTPRAQEWNDKFQQLKKEQFKLHGMAAMSSEPSARVSPAAMLGNSALATPDQ